MSENKEQKTQSTAKIVATEALSTAIISAASVVGCYVGLMAIGWTVQKYNDKKNNKK